MTLQAFRTAPTNLKILMLGSFLMVIGFYSLLPRLSLHLSGHLGWTMALTGAILALRQISQQGLSAVGGVVVDSLGPKRTLILGLLIRGLGFLYFAWSRSFFDFALAALLSGVGGCLFDPAEKAAFEAGSRGKNREELYAVREVADNLAFALSAVLSVGIAFVNFTVISVFSSLIYFLVAGTVILKLKDVLVTPRQVRMQDLITVARDRLFVSYTLVLAGYFYLSCQLYSLVPKIVETHGKSTAFLSTLYCVIAAFVVFAQVPISHWLKTFPFRFRLIGLGTFLMGLGHFMLGFSHTGTQVLFAIFYAMGLIIAAPVIFEVVPYFAPPSMRGTYYGFNNYAIGIGGTLSGLIGGVLFDAGQALRWPYVVSTSSLLAGTFVFVGLFRFDRKMLLRRAHIDQAKLGDIDQPLVGKLQTGNHRQAQERQLQEGFLKSTADASARFP